MYNALLLTDEGWLITKNLDKVLNHAGEAFVNENIDEFNANVAEIGARENGYARQFGNFIKVTERPVINPNEPGANERIRDEVSLHGVAYAQHLNNWADHNIDGETIAIFVVPDYRANDANYQAHAAAWVGYVATSDDTAYGMKRVTFDMKLWNKCQKFRKQVGKKRAVAASRAHLTASDFTNECYGLCASLGCGDVHKLSVPNFWAWVVAHDAVKGLRETNKRIGKLAVRWMNNREKSKKWLAKWHSDETVAKVDARFEKAVPKKRTPTPKAEPATA